MGQDQYPALGEARETAKLLPRGESPWWRDEGRHLLILCLFSIRGMRLAHMHNAKSREHAHTYRKARAILKLRYKNKNKNNLTGTLDLASLPISMENLNLAGNKFTGSIGLERLPARMESIRVFCNQLSGSYISDPMPSLSRSTWKDCQPGWRRLVMRENRLRSIYSIFTIIIYFEAVVLQEG